MSVHRFLVTGSEEQIIAWHRAVASKLNDVARRGQTVHYTCFAEDVEFALAAAPAADVTVEEIVDDDAGEEAYAMRHLGSHGLTWAKELERLRATQRKTG